MSARFTRKSITRGPARDLASIRRAIATMASPPRVVLTPSRRSAATGRRRSL